MSATLAACRAPVVSASSASTCRQHSRVAAPLQPLRPCSSAPCFRRTAVPQQGRRQGAALVVRADGNTGGGGNGEFKKNTQFGYSRKDVILIGVGLTGGGYILYYGLQATGMEPGIAGNWVQLIIILGMTLGWVGSYLYRVATKKMTYAQQLDDYEEAVMMKRLEEMPEQEIGRLLEEVDDDKEKKRLAREQRQKQQQEQQ